PPERITPGAGFIEEEPPRGGGEPPRCLVEALYVAPALGLHRIGPGCRSGWPRLCAHARLFHPHPFQTGYGETTDVRSRLTWSFAAVEEGFKTVDRDHQEVFAVEGAVACGPSAPLLVPQRHDRIDARRAPRRDVAGDECHDREQHRDGG